MEKVKKFTIGKKQFTAKFPNVGQILDIDSMTQALSNGLYGSIVASGLASAYYALDLIDAISFYQIVTPEVGKYFDIQNYAELELSDAQDLISTYKEQIQPWYVETMNEIRGIAKQSMEDARDNEGEGETNG